MRIKKYTVDDGENFKAIMECEHCGHKQELTYGRHDHDFHLRVIPGLKCGNCGKTRNDLRSAAA
jgi:DNA-directed RNA polymerase subunit RPC12/RpoP